MRYLLPVLCLQFLACEEMPQSTTTKVAGLWTNPNDTRAPEGALAVADNVVLSRPGVAEPRRGFTAQNTTIGEAVNAYDYFDGYLIQHTGAGTLRRSSDDGVTWTSYAGTFSPPDASTKVRFWQSSGSLLFTSSDGIYELDSATGTPRLTGVARAHDGTATLVKTNANGWMAADGQAAYRVAWLYRNGNEKVQYGGPSGRFLVSNPAPVTIAAADLDKASGTTTVVATKTAHAFAVNDYVTIALDGAETYFAAGTYLVTAVTANTFTYDDGVAAGGSVRASVNGATAAWTGTVSLSIPIPAEITTDYALQVFRSALSVTDDTEPTDALGLVYEAVPTNVDIAAGSITISDLTPDSLRGADWQDLIPGGAAQDRPPKCKDATLWRGVSLYSCTSVRHRMTLRLLSTSGLSTSAPSALWFSGDNSVAAGASESSGVFKVFSDGSVAQNIANTAKSIVRAINDSVLDLRAYYVSGEADAPGEFVVEAVDFDAFGGGEFYAYVENASGAQFAPSLPGRVYSTAGQISRAGSTVTVNTQVAHGFVVGQTLTKSDEGDANFPGGTKTVASVADSDTFTYTEAGAAVSSAAEEYFQPSDLATRVLSGADDYPNSIMWSAPDQPWSVSLFNQAFVGNEGVTILRIVPTRDKVLIFTTAGIYQLLGDYPNFTIAELDPTVKLAAYNTAVPLAGRTFSLSTQGVVEVADSARVVSIAIDDALRDLLANHASNVALRAFAVPYESERMLLLWLPDDSSDAYAAQAFVYHLDSQQWTRWTVPATAGFVHPEQDRLYLGSSDTTGITWKERKARTAADHTDVSAAIASTVEWAPVLPAGPGGSALVDTGSLDFQEANFSAASVQFATNHDATLSAVETLAGPSSASPAEVTFVVPTSYQRATRYRVRFSHATASQRFQLQGMTLNYRKTSGRTGR